MTRWTLEGLSARRGSFRLGPVDASVGPGEVLAVLGPSGAGKTTLLRTLAGLAPPSEGRVLRDGDDWTERAPEHRAMAYVPQGLALFEDRTVRRNIAYPRELRGEDRGDTIVPRLVDRFGLAALQDRRPRALSTGEQQRVAIARALAAQPELLIWDEPLVALDLLSRVDLIEAIREVQRTDGLPVVLVTHDPTIAFSLADRFLLLDHGSVRFLGDAATLVGAPPDPFAARFAGFENVYSTAQLGRGGDAPFVGHLRSRAGATGIGLRSPTATSGGGAWTATARRVSASPIGWRCEAEIDGLTIRLALPTAGTVRPGDPVGFSLSGTDTVALGTGEAPA
ncbi:MAG: ATP-binding cassette domain-containing protein [Thermoplasmata archaeon]|nr:ATP-binding cassette domain-containing protein [Thermoplasmata archaeon]